MANLLIRGAGILLAFAPLCNSLMGQADCSQATVVGTYGVSSQGIMFVAVPGSAQPVAVAGASLGLISVDWQGSISGTGVNAIRGEITQGPTTGTVTVNSDCTGEVKWDFGARALIAVLNDGAEIRGVMVESTAGKPVWQGTWKRISRQPSTVDAEQCSTTAVRGKYVYTYQGTILTPVAGSDQTVPTPMVLGGIASVGYDGVISGPGVSSMAGEIVNFEMADAKLTVNPDCSATDVFGLKVEGAVVPGQGKEWAVVLDGGAEVWTILTQGAMGKPIALGFWKQISHTP